MDTNVLSDALRNPDGKAARGIAGCPPDELCTSIVVASELRFGSEKKGSVKLSKRIEALLETLEVLPLSPPADRVYAKIRSQLEARGVPIGGNDLFIAAQALSLGLTVVTDNDAEFRRIDGLSVENWLR